MNLPALFSLIASLYALLSEILSSERRKWCITLLSFFMLMSLVPVTYGLFDLITSPKSIRRRIIRSIIEIVFSSDSDGILFDIKNRFNFSLYCNPFLSNSVSCNHVNPLILSGKGETEDVDFSPPPYDCLNIILVFNENPVGCVDPKVPPLFGGIHDYPDSFGAIFLNSISNVEKVIGGLRGDASLHYTIRLVETEIVIHYRIDGLSKYFITRKGSKTRSEGSFNFTLSKLIYLIRVFEYCKEHDRVCCFVLEDDFRKKRSGHIGHCVDVEGLVRHLELGGFVKYARENKHGLVLEGVELLSSKYKGISEVIEEFLNLFYSKFKEELTEYLIKRESTRGKRVLSNWQWKRFTVDISYIREMAGGTKLYGSDRSVAPTTRVVNFCESRRDCIIGKWDKDLRVFRKMIPIPIYPISTEPNSRALGKMKGGGNDKDKNTKKPPGDLGGGITVREVVKASKSIRSQRGGPTIVTFCGEREKSYKFRGSRIYSESPYVNKTNEFYNRSEEWKEVTKKGFMGNSKDARLDGNEIVERLRRRIEFNKSYSNLEMESKDNYYEEIKKSVRILNKDEWSIARFNKKMEDVNNGKIDKTNCKIKGAHVRKVGRLIRAVDSCLIKASGNRFRVLEACDEDEEGLLRILDTEGGIMRKGTKCTSKLPAKFEKIMGGPKSEISYLNCSISSVIASFKCIREFKTSVEKRIEKRKIKSEEKKKKSEDGKGKISLEERKGKAKVEEPEERKGRGKGERKGEGKEKEIMKLEIGRQSKKEGEKKASKEEIELCRLEKVRKDKEKEDERVERVKGEKAMREEERDKEKAELERQNEIYLSSNWKIRDGFTAKYVKVKDQNGAFVNKSFAELNGVDVDLRFFIDKISDSLSEDDRLRLFGCIIDMEGAKKFKRKVKFKSC